MGDIVWNVSKEKGRLESLATSDGPPLIEYAAHEYSRRGNLLRDRLPSRPFGRFTNLKNIEYVQKDGWDVYSGILYNNVTELQGASTFISKFREEDGALRMIAIRHWRHRENVYDDSIYFIHNHLNHHSIGCRICRRLTRDRNCNTCYLYKPWWTVIGISCPDDIYYKWYTPTGDNAFTSGEPVIKKYLKTMSHREVGVFSAGTKGSSTEIRGPKHSLKIEVVDTTCENAQLRVVTIKTHEYLETEYQFDWPGQRMRGDTSMVELKITPHMV